MVFELGQEQLDFQKTVRRFFETECDSAVVRRFIAEDSTEDRARLANAFKSLGLGAVFGVADSAREALPELILFAAECGRSLVPLHFLESVVAGPLFGALLIDERSRHEISRVFGTEVMDGILSESVSTVRAPFFYQAGSSLSVRREGGSVSVSGTVRLVPLIAESRFMLYSAADTTLLISLVAEERQVARVREHALDLTQPREQIVLVEAPAAEITVLDQALVRALSCTLIAAELSGACCRVLEMTSEYLKTRKQFGVAIGSFQAVQHALADMLLKSELIESLVSFSSWALMHSPAQRELSAQSALRLALRESVGIVEKAIQLHGGIGFTWEHDLHLYLRRVRSLCALVGDPAHLDSHLLVSVQAGM